MILARNSHTPIPFWLSQPLWKLFRWIKANNAIVAEEGEEVASNGK